jgi:DNA end-binding protein Ku
LVEDMTEHWNPAAFKDTYHSDLMARVREKIRKGETKVMTPAEKEAKGEAPSAQVIDLAELLRQSLGKGGSRKPPLAARKAAAETPGKPSLRLVPAPRSAAKAAARRKRA